MTTPKLISRVRLACRVESQVSPNWEPRKGTYSVEADTLEQALVLMTQQAHDWFHQWTEGAEHLPTAMWQDWPRLTLSFRFVTVAKRKDEV